MGKPAQLDELEILNKDDRIFKAVGSMEICDRDGEIIPIEEFKKVMPVMMKRGGTFIDSHTNRVVGKLLNYEFAKRPTATGEKEAVIITGQVFKDYPIDDQVWENIKSGDYEGVSFGGGMVKRTFDPKTNAYKLTGLSGFEFSGVDRPANQGALFEAVNHFAKGYNIKKGPLCMGVLQEKGMSAEEAHDVCYADAIASGERESQSEILKDFVAKGKELDHCVQNLMNDETFKPRVQGQTKEQAAFAVCTASLNKVHVDDLQKVENDLSKKEDTKERSRTDTGSGSTYKMANSNVQKEEAAQKREDMPEEETHAPTVEERLDKIEGMLTSMMEKQGDIPQKADEEEPEEEEESTEKGSGETVTSTDVPQDHDEEKPAGTDSATVIKENETLAKELQEVKKELGELRDLKKQLQVKKGSTPRPQEREADIKKSQGVDTSLGGVDPLAVAQGKVNLNMMEIQQRRQAEIDNQIKKGLGY